MADEPSPHELAWRLAEVQRLLGELVGRAEYQARLESAERRFGELADDVDRLDRKHDADIVRVHTRLDGHEKAHAASGLSWRQIAYTAIPSALVALLAVLVQIWLSGRH